MRCLLAFVAMCCLGKALAQNLVPNPSFELQDTCPYLTGFQGNSKPHYWENWNQSPEYFDACAGTGGGLDTLLDVPLNGFGYQCAFDGDAYVGMFAYGYVSWLPDNIYREYVGCQLLQPLEVGEIYELSFYTNAAIDGTPWPMQWVCNNMGMLFTMQPNIWTYVDEPHFAVRNYAQLHSTAVISDTAGWTLVSGSFMADSAYAYLVLGNFFSNTLTDTLHLNTGTSLGAYYYVDDVCVVLAGQQCDSSEGIYDHASKSPQVWPNPTAELLWVAETMNGESWQIYEPAGRIIASGTARGGPVTISVGEWAPGAYVLCLGSDLKRTVRFTVMR